MLNIVAIGGGSIALPKRKPQTFSIDAAVVKLCGKKRPRVLFLPTASDDWPKYSQTFTRYYETHFACQVETLWLWKQSYTAQELKTKILNADIIYIGGGNTLRMMKRWRSLGVDTLLKAAAKKGVVLAGLSAGSICWFREGHSDSLKYSNPKAPYIRVRGLDLVDLLVCPHYRSELKRRKDLFTKLKHSRTIAVGIENCSAIQVQGDRFRIITSNSKAKAWKMYWQNNRIVETAIPSGVWQPLKTLMLRGAHMSW
jgi:dipeptidase E